MPGTFRDSWKLTKTSFRMIREDRALLVFPVVVGLSILGVIALLLVGEYALLVALAGARGGPTNGLVAAAVALFLVAYFAMVFLSVYGTAALIAAATLKLNGRQPTAADGWRVARARIGRLLLWALITATVGLVIQAISSRVRGVGGVVIGAVGGATWAVVTYFVVPVLLYENERTWASLKRSVHLFTSTFGRSLVSNLVVALLLGAGIVVAVVLGLAGLLLAVHGGLLLGFALVGVAIAVGVGVALIGAAAEGILRAALYRYATTGKIDPDLMPAGYGAATPLAPNAPLP
ncbi:MAG TPA: DUF6159 family protein [Thermoplasmata archaeon]|nr:DUF6159 family protein [Thermoplasmata archaeon]